MVPVTHWISAYGYTPPLVLERFVGLPRSSGLDLTDAAAILTVRTVVNGGIWIHDLRDD
jgi:hypothetical protein